MLDLKNEKKVKNLKVLFVASEVYPLIKTGGLADVVGSLPVALNSLGIEVRILLPGYPEVMRKISRARSVHVYDNLFGFPARVLSIKKDTLSFFVLDQPGYFDRPGNPYLRADGIDWPDNWIRFASLGRAAADIASGNVTSFKPDILHAHDWQTGLAGAYLNYQPGNKVKTVFTVHNLAYQGKFSQDIFPGLGLPHSAFSLDGLEYYGGVGFLKSGIWFSDAITTVSPTYAAEISTFGGGMGLDGLLRSRKNDLAGITNGIDFTVWNPETDTLIPQNFTADTLDARKKNKRALEKEFGLEPGEGPIFAVVSRLSWQKGLDLIAESLDEMISAGIRIALIGQGEFYLENLFGLCAQKYPGRFSAQFGYDEEKSHLVQAGADVIMVPSRFEPCGLTQLFGLRYGCVPLAADVGGLADTIIDSNQASVNAGVSTGFLFRSSERASMMNTVRRALELYRNEKAWQKIQSNGMASDVSWNNSAAKYKELYQKLQTPKTTTTHPG